MSNEILTQLSIKMTQNKNNKQVLGLIGLFLTLPTITGILLLILLN